jgi:hypothetical protein
VATKTAKIVVATLTADHPAHRNGRYFVGWELAGSGQINRGRKQFNQRPAAERYVIQKKGTFEKAGYAVTIKRKGMVD